MSLRKGPGNTSVFDAFSSRFDAVQEDSLFNLLWPNIRATADLRDLEPLGLGSTTYARLRAKLYSCAQPTKAPSSARLTT